MLLFKPISLNFPHHHQHAAISYLSFTHTFTQTRRTAYTQLTLITLSLRNGHFGVVSAVFNWKTFVNCRTRRLLTIFVCCCLWTACIVAVCNCYCNCSCHYCNYFTDCVMFCLLHFIFIPLTFICCYCHYCCCMPEDSEYSSDA